MRVLTAVCENGWIEYGDSCYYFSLEEELYSWPNALVTQILI